MAGIYNIIIEQGATFTFSAQWKDSTGTVINIRDYNARMQIRKYSNHGEVLITLSDETTISGISISAENLLTVNIDSDITKYFVSGEYVYDLLLINKNTFDVTRFIEGTVTISEGVTVLE